MCRVCLAPSPRSNRHPNWDLCHVAPRTRWYGRTSVCLVLNAAEAAKIGSQLRQLVGRRIVEPSWSTDFPELAQLVSGASQLGDPTVVDLIDAIDLVIDDLRDPAGEGAARQLFLTDWPGGALKTRATAAAAEYGISYDAFRRKRVAGGTSRLDDLVNRLALLLVEASSSGTEETTPMLPMTQPEVLGATTSTLPSKNVLLAAVALLVSLAGIGALVAAANENRDDTSSRAATSTQPVSPGSTESAAEVAVTGDGVAATAVPTNDTIEATAPEATACSLAPGEGAPAMQELIDDTEAEAIIAGLGCPSELAELRGSLHFQRFHRGINATGGIIGLPDGEILTLNIGQYQSYIRIGGGDGGRSSTLGGMPTGVVSQVGADEWRYQLDSKVLLVAEQQDSTYYWLPEIVATKWLETGGREGVYGAPAGSPRVTGEGIRQDFENGYLVLVSEGELEWRPLLDDGSEKAPEIGISGGIISAADGTGWFVDEREQRWWIPDLRTYECVGGGANQRKSDLPGHEIHAMPFGGVVQCPAVVQGLYPAEGGLLLDEFCKDTISALATARFDDVANQWWCQATASVPVNLGDACRWQYGPAAVAVENGDGGWRCEGQ